MESVTLVRILDKAVGTLVLLFFLHIQMVSIIAT